MIIKSNTLYSKNQILTVIILEVVIAAIVLTGIGLIIASSILDVKTYQIIGCVLSSFGIFEIAQFVSVFFKHRFILFLIFGKIFKYKINEEPKEAQEEVLTKFFANNESTIKCCTVLVSGKKGCGKSKCTDYIINMTLSKFKNMSIKRQFIYIDCYNDSRLTTDAILNYKSYNLNNALIIIDNCNEAEWSVMDRLIKLSISDNCSVLIIEEDTENFRNKLQDLSPREHKIIPLTFTDVINNDNKTVNRLLTSKLTDAEKEVIIACALYCKFYNIFEFRNIVNVLGIKGLDKLNCYKIFNKLLRNNVIYHFPMNTEYYKFKQECDLEYIINSKLYNENLFDKIIDVLSTQPAFQNAEVAWLIMLNHSKNVVLKTVPAKRRNLFINAAKFCNYQKLYDALKSFTDKYSCKDEFLYEYGYLYYNLNNFAEAFNSYNSYFYDDDWEEKIRIIELLHTSSNKQMQMQVKSCLNALKKEREPISLFAKYWDLHIQNERGNFYIAEIHSLLNELINIQTKDDITHTHIERCFTDELRMYWITNSLDENTNDNLLKIFTHLYSDDKKFNFYKDLYFEAGFSHYVKLTNAFLDPQPDTLNIGNRLGALEEEAEKAYRNALNDSYGRVRSTATAKIKLTDLQSIREDSEFNELIESIKDFRSDSEKKHSSLHVAFAESVMAKIVAVKKMFDPSCIVGEDIKKQVANSLKKAENIYKSFGNKYGVLRCHYLKTMTDILSNFGDCKNRIVSLEKETKNFVLENRFCNKILNLKVITFLNIYNSIKYYPIILQ